MYVQENMEQNVLSCLIHKSLNAKNVYTTLKIKKICFSPKVSIQPCRPKSDSALLGAI